jgi:hypothetical protein
MAPPDTEETPMKRRTTRRGTASCGMIATGVALCVPMAAMMCAAGWMSFQFHRQCATHLKMAADAGSIATAKDRLDKALAYLEANGITKGHTYVAIAAPTWEIAPWYDNLKEEQAHLANFPSNATESDKNNALMKFREVLIDHGADGDHVTLPHNIEEAPYNTAMFLGWWVTGFLAIIGVVLVIVGCDP